MAADSHESVATLLSEPVHCRRCIGCTAPLRAWCRAVAAARRLQLPATMMSPYPLTLQLGMKRFHGHVFLGRDRLYFVCTKQGGAWAAAIGQSVGGLVGAAIAATATAGPGQAPAGTFDEEAIARAVAEHDGSLIMEASKLQEIKETLWWRLIRFDGKKLGLPRGLGKELKLALGPWARQNNVKTKGLPS